MPSTTATIDDVTKKITDIAAKTQHTDAAVKEIRKAILEKGVSVLADTTLDELPDKIREIFVMKTTESSPVGEIIAFMGQTAPEHYLICDGATYAIGSYPLLEAFITTQFGSVDFFGGDGTNTFAVPDLRGEFLRGTGENGHENQGSGADVGVHQNGTELPNFQNYQNKTIGVDVGPAGWNVIHTADKLLSIGTTRWYNDIGMRINNNVPGVTNYLTTRPTNTSVLYCIKYEPTYATGSEGGGSTEEPPMTDTDMREILEYVFTTDDSNTTESEVKTV